jgi:hypothetical protein
VTKKWKLHIRINTDVNEQKGGKGRKKYMYYFRTTGRYSTYKVQQQSIRKAKLLVLVKNRDRDLNIRQQCR